MDIKSKLSSSRLLFAIVIIIVVSLGVYANTLFNGFVYDDTDQVLKNSWIRDIRNIPTIFSSPTLSFSTEKDPHTNYYRPMMHLIYMAEYPVFGLKPWGWHLINILFHAMNSIMVFLIAVMLFNKQGTFNQPQISNLKSQIPNPKSHACAYCGHLLCHPPYQYRGRCLGCWNT